jgi:predicted CoA-substrate-specific enzyme activase
MKNFNIYIGIDIGTVSLKTAILADGDAQPFFETVKSESKFFFQPPSGEPSLPLLVNQYQRIKGNPVETAREVLQNLFSFIPRESVKGIRICGSGAGLIGDILNIKYENEFRAIAHAVGLLYPDISTVFEMGGQNAKFLTLTSGSIDSQAGISDYEKSGDCAAGTGSFLDQQASRLKYRIEDIGDIVSKAERTAKIAGRCSVFAKSDMIHAQQKGFQPSEVFKGLCEAVARNFKSSIVKGKTFEKPVLFIGGVASNSGVVEALKLTFNIQDSELIVPEYYAWMGAIGAAMAARKDSSTSLELDISKLSRSSTSRKDKVKVTPPLSMENVILLRDQIKPRIIEEHENKIDAFLGIDIGSVSTNLVLLDIDGRMITEIYTRTEGRPIEVVDRCLHQIAMEFGDRIIIKGVGTTGSGRELIGELVGADTINDEITAHKTGAEFLGKNMLDNTPDTIFEIGGQDSKYISIENGVVVDFAMNEACAAGTGSFLEERAEELGISVKNEFARLALSSDAPIKLGERCTVFMQQDVAAHQQRGATKQDLTAGLAYSVVYNYLNRVVRDRHIGKVIFFQGGTAYNDAIASAFASVLNKKIIVPPYNGVVGAVGMALLAREKAEITQTPSKFRGFSLENVDYSLREFTCKACTNYCQMQEFTVEGEKTYWGDQCSDKFRRHRLNVQKPVIEDLIEIRRELFFQDYDPKKSGKSIIGLPRGLYIHEQFPFWQAFFNKLGHTVILSDETNGSLIKAGIEASVAEPCIPIQAYHGHVINLLDKKVDWIFIPNNINSATTFKNVNSYYCPWGQTMPFVVQSSPMLEKYTDQILAPALRFRDGKSAIKKSLYKSLKKLGETQQSVGEAVEAAYSRQTQVDRQILDSGRKALKTLQQSSEIGIVLVGRTYNIHDRGLTLDIGNKLRSYYGVNVIPMDFLDVDRIDISEVNANMYWNYGRKIIAAAKIVGQYPNLHIIYMTNFKCGPDSYIKHYITEASGKPFLTLQFDGHGNDAGYITRCEAYLDSKGALRRWRKSNIENELTQVTV